MPKRVSGRMSVPKKAQSMMEYQTNSRMVCESGTIEGTSIGKRQPIRNAADSDYTPRGLGLVIHREVKCPRKNYCNLKVS